MNHQSVNPLPMQESDANPGQICKSITNLPIPCQSANPGQIRQSIANHRPIQSSNTNPCQYASHMNLPIHYQSVNPRPIGQSNVNFWWFNLYSDNPWPVRQYSGKHRPICQYNTNPGLICQSIANPPIHKDHITITKWPLHTSISANNGKNITTDWQRIGTHWHRSRQSRANPVTNP